MSSRKSRQVITKRKIKLIPVEEAFKLYNWSEKRGSIEEKLQSLYAHLVISFLCNRRQCFCEQRHIDASVLSKVVNFTPSCPSMCRVARFSDIVLFLLRTTHEVAALPPPPPILSTFILFKVRLLWSLEGLFSV